MKSVIGIALSGMVTACVGGPLDESDEDVAEAQSAVHGPDVVFGSEGAENWIALASPVEGGPGHGWANKRFPNHTIAEDNSVMGIGFNVGPGNGRDDSSMHGAWLAIESGFETSAGGAVHTEMFFQYYGDDGTSRRPIGATIDTETHASHVALIGKTSFLSSEGEQTLIVGENGLVTIVSVDPNQSFLLKDGNDTPIVGGTGSDGRVVEVARVGSDDKLYLNAPGDAAAVRANAPFEAGDEARFEHAIHEDTQNGFYLSQAIDGDFLVDVRHPKHIKLDGGDEHRNVVLPPPADCGGRWRKLMNAGATHDLVVREGSPAGRVVAVLGPREVADIGSNTLRYEAWGPY
jgi:hypothetical protein